MYVVNHVFSLSVSLRFHFKMCTRVFLYSSSARLFIYLNMSVFVGIFVCVCGYVGVSLIGWFSSVSCTFFFHSFFIRVKCVLVTCYILFISLYVFSHVFSLSISLHFQFQMCMRVLLYSSSAQMCIDLNMCVCVCVCIQYVCQAYVQCACVRVCAHACVCVSCVCGLIFIG